VRYRELTRLFDDLRALGETNALIARARTFLSRATLADVAKEYRSRFTDEQGRFVASFDIVYLTGWTAHESQQKPLAPGGARQRLADALGTVERKTGEKVSPRPLPKEI
jgi:hypothetical protein